jgi:hypothetical protein
VNDWCIIYDDLSTFDSSQGGPEESPGGGVLAIVRRDETVDYKVMHGGGHFDLGYYWWQDDQWFLGSVSGMQMYLMEPGWKVVRFGRTVTQERWHEMWDLIEDMFGTKASWWPNEPRR